ncbi:class I glutamine amidotransferase-like protein [Biscogniauxia mediterranea]|nr:class I glutamine amidotransferase-like protein [Biscogniauxia mediterranea]
MASANKTDSSNGRHVVNVGVFIPTQCQLLDAACVDIIGSLSYEYISAALRYFVPHAVLDQAPSVRIHYIGSVRAGETIPLSANELIVATNHFSDPEVAPGKLDIVLVPGPDPSGAFPEEALAWLRAQGHTEGVDVLSVCTGIFLCAEAGLIKGRSVCGPRGFQDRIREKGYGEKALLGHKLRWVQDGNFWSSGGVTNGNDLVAAYIRATPRHFPAQLAEIACELTEVGDRPQEYTKEYTMWDMIKSMSADATTAEVAAKDAA